MSHGRHAAVFGSSPSNSMVAAMLRLSGFAAVLLPAVALAQDDPAPAPAPPAPAPVASKSSTGGIPIELTSLRLMREKNVITQAEYDEAVVSMRDTMGVRADETATVMLAKWSTTLYGFVKSDFIFDSTQSFDE